jgi:hypothetical protein
MIGIHFRRQRLKSPPAGKKNPLKWIRLVVFNPFQWVCHLDRPGLKSLATGDEITDIHEQ